MTTFRGFLPVLLVLTLLAGAYFWTYPQWTALSDARTQLAAANTKNESLKQSQAQMDTFLSKYRSAGDNIAKANRVLPLKRSEMESVLANLDTYAQTSGVSLAGIGFADPTNNVGDQVSEAYTISYVEMSLSATGSYASFRAFLLQLENSLRLMDIHSVNLSYNESGNLDYKLTARAYYQK